MSSNATILIVEDDRRMRTFLRTLLEGNDYHCVIAKTGEEAIVDAATHAPEIILLDLGLPDIDGMEVVKRIREWSETPILVISARGREQDKVAALDAGADDYLTKPFGAEELLARIRVARRHRIGTREPNPVFEFGDVEVNLAARRVRRGNEEVHLTRTEYELLIVLVRHSDKVLTHRQILKEVWGPNNTDQVAYTRVYMANLRKKLEADPAEPRHLLTEVGVGYRLSTEPVR